MLLGLLLCLGSGATWAYEAGDCVRCHGQGTGRGSTSPIALDRFETSVHGGLITCGECHRAVKDASHQGDPEARRVDCNDCHEQVNRHGWKSKGAVRPACQSCHTKHAIRAKKDPASSVHEGNLRQTCRGCHPLPCGQRGYLSWFPSLRIASHPKQDFSRDHSKYACIGCHQGDAAHGESGPLDGRNCRPCHLSPDGRSALWGPMHPAADFRAHPAVFAAAATYQVFVGLLLGGGIWFLLRRLTRRPGGRR